MVAELTNSRLERMTVPAGLSPTTVREVLRRVPTTILRDALADRSGGAGVGRYSDVELLREMEARGYSVYRVEDGFVLDGLLMDGETRQVTWRNESYQLTPREFAVLVAIARAWPKPASSARIAQAVWGMADADTVNSARVYVRYVRRKIPGLLQSAQAQTGDGHRHYWLDLAGTASNAESHV